MTEHTQSLEPVEREPINYKDVDYDTACAWRDADTKMLASIRKFPGNPDKAVMIEYFEVMLDYMNGTLDDCRIFDEPAHDEKPIDEDKMKAFQHRGR